MPLLMADDKKSILIADDDDLLRQSIREILESANYLVDEACNGNEALQALRKRTYDLFITDIIMPEKEGIETIFEARDLYPDLPIVSMSGGGRIDAFDHLNMASGIKIHATLQKPFQFKELLNLVQEAFT